MKVQQLVSVVMPSFNQAEFITEAVESVFSQGYDPIELIVSDGGSSDGTSDVLASLSRKHPRLRWWSEPDNGPAHALNKALRNVRGTIIGWLNSDDLYAPGTIPEIVAAFAEHPDWIMLYGQGEHVDKEAVPIGIYPTLKPEVGLGGFASGCFICQPSVFFRTSMYAMLGPLNESLGTTFDYEYWMRAFKKLNDRIGFVDRVLAKSRLHDACITMRQRRKIALEGVSLSKKFLGAAETHWLTTYFEEVYNLPAEERGFDDLQSHCLETIKLVENDVDQETVLGLRRQLELLSK